MTVPALLMVMALGVSGAGSISPLVMETSNVRLEVRRSADGWHETYLVRSDGHWQTVLKSGHRLRTDPSVVYGGHRWEHGFTDASLQIPPGGGRSLLLSTKVGGVTLSKHITLDSGADIFHIDVSCSVSGSVTVSQILSTYSFFPRTQETRGGKPPDFIFTPQLRPESTDVIGDHTFRSPALIMQQDSRLAALVPDLNAIDVRSRRVQSAADVRVDSPNVPMFSYGLLPWRTRSHVYYKHTDSMTVLLRDTTVRYAFSLFVRGGAPELTGYREVVRFLWERYGRGSLAASVGPQKEPLASYMKTAWYEYLPLVALDTVYNGIPVTLLRQARLAWSNKLHAAADNDAWFDVWFNSLRTAFGMFLYGEAAGDLHLQKQAERVLDLALLAPNPQGIAPSIFYVDSLGGHWVADHAWGGIRGGQYYAMFHNAWTCYWLLQWSEVVPERTLEIYAYCSRFADFLCHSQAASGVIPSWYNPETLEPAPELRDENAETAGAAFFLGEFALRTRNPRYEAAAVKAMDYVLREIVPARRWFDFETFYSCARKPLDFFDRFTGQHPQNTLSMHQAAEACLVLEKLTGKHEYAERGQEILDYLCFYQQVWSPRWLSCELFGGFGVQNTDGEWSDSRQAYVAVTFMHYFQRTGQREYLERAVAAARAQFSLFESPQSPRTAENYAHGGSDKLAGVTGLHWGTGSAVVSFDLLVRKYGDAYVDIHGAWGAGIDGCTIEQVSVNQSTVDIRIRDDVKKPRALRVVFGGLQSGRYRLVVNGLDLGWISAGELRNGTMIGLQ